MLVPILLDESEAERRSQNLLRSLGIVALGLGTIVLTGWAFDVGALKSIRPGWSSMKANCAICFCLLGLGFLIGHPVHAWQRRLRQGLALIVFALAGTTLAQDLLGFDARVDQLFVLDDAQGSVLGLPGRMSPATALGIGLTAIAVLAARWPALSQRFALLAAAFGGVSLLSYIYGVDPLDRLVTFSAMSLHSSVGLIVVAVGALFLRPTFGLPAALLDRSTSGVQLRRLLPTALLVPLAIGMLGLAGRRAGWWEVQFEGAVVSTATIFALLGLFVWFYRSLRESESEKLSALRSLTASEARYRTTFENALIGIAHLASDGRWLRANQRICEILGYSEEELREETYSSVSELEDLQLDVVQWEMLKRGEIEDYGVERRFRSKSGEEVVTDVRLVREEDDAGELQYFTLVLQDITGRKISEGTLRVYERALAGTQNGISIADATKEDLPLIYTNAAFLEMTGYDASEVLGKNCRFLNRKARDQAALGELRMAIEAGEDCSVLLRNHRKDGTGFWNQLAVAPVEDSDGKISHYVGIMSDATDLVQASAEREELLREAEGANLAKDRFLSIVSHELRSPLNAILAWSSILEEEAEDESVVRAAKAIESAVRSQTRLVNDLLDVSRIRGGKLEVTPVRMDLSSEVRAAADQLVPLSEERGLTLDVRCPPEPLEVMADPERMAQVVRNLIDNSLKFTPENGRVEVILSKGADANGAETVHLEVRDTGVGLTPAAQSLIFDEFWQADTPGSAGAKGLGLGLSIVRHLVERQGGTIEARSDGLGRGTSVLVILPAEDSPITTTAEGDAENEGPSASAAHRTSKKAPEPEPEPEFVNEAATGSDASSGREATRDASELAGLEIVVVDDDAPTVEALATLLEKRNALVRRAYSVAEALRHFEGKMPDLLVSDIGLPDRSGMELIQSIREMDGPVRSILAIAVTGMVDPDSRAKIQRAGFNLILNKPAPPSRIIEHILRLRELDRMDPPPPRSILLIGDESAPNRRFRAMLEDQGHFVELIRADELSIERVREVEAEFLIFSAETGGSRLDGAAERMAAAPGKPTMILLCDTEDEIESSIFDFVLTRPVDFQGLWRILSFQEVET